MNHNISARRYTQFLSMIFIGDDWKGNSRWSQTEVDMQKVGVDVVYLSYTKGVSSTLLRENGKKNELDKNNM